jgi:CheY-like chemotaxis protein
MAGVLNGSVRVLIADDKADIRSIIATRLRIEPAFDVVGEASDGAEAIARVGEVKPEIMILDLQMPVMSGEEVIPILRSLAPRLRILVFSAYAGMQRLRASERPDAEVRKGTGLAPLVKELHRLAQRTPADLVQVDLGRMDVAPSLTAAHAWARLNPGVREVAVEHGTAPDFLALVGVFLALGEPLKLADTAGLASAGVCFTSRLEAGRAARRALEAIDGPEAELLEPLRSRLLAALPDGAATIA